MKRCKLLAILLCLAMLLSFAACGGDEAQPAADASNAAAPAANAPSDGDFRTDYKLSYNHQMAGDWIAEFVNKEISSFVVDVMGFSYESPAFNFDSDQELADCQNLISAGVNGHMYYAAFDTLTPTICDLFAEAKVPFVTPENPPQGAALDALLECPYFVGAIYGDYYGSAYSLGERAAQMGCKNAIMLVGTIGVYGQEQRLKGFTDGFEANGGTVLEAARVNDNSEAAQAANDLYAAHADVADCVYAADPGMLEACFTAQANYGVDLMAFGSDLGSDHLQYVRDGKLVADGGHIPCFSVNACFLVNYLDGHPILDEDGKAPVIWDWKFFTIDETNVDAYETYYLNKNQHIADEDYQKLLYRYNPDVTYQDFIDFKDGFSLDYLVENAK